MERVLERIDSPRGIGAFVVVVSLIAGFMIAFRGVLDGEAQTVGYFVIYVAGVVAVVTIAVFGWERHLS